MQPLLMLIFAGVFTVTALLISAGAMVCSSGNKKVLANLDSALAPTRPQSRLKIVDFRKSELLSAIPWMHRSLSKYDIVPRIRTMLSQADLRWTVGAVLLMCAICFAGPAYLLDLRTGSLIFTLVIASLTGILPLAFVWFKRSQRFGKFEQGLPDALDMLVSALRAGHSFGAAMGLVTRECPDPIGSEFRIAFDQHNFGVELRTALESLTARVPLQDLRIAITAILIQRESGGNLAEVLEKTAYVIRQRFRLRRQVQVHTAQGRLTGLVLTVLPIALGIGLYIINPEMMSLLWKRQIGIKLLWAAGGMLLTGTLLIQKIVRMDV